MVEMIFVLPLLLLLVFAIAEFGLMFSRWLTLSNAVREGARTGVVYRDPCNNTTVRNAVRSAVATYAQAGGVPIAPADVDVSGMCDRGNQLEVAATYDFVLRIPFSNVGTIPISYTSRMRNE